MRLKFGDCVLDLGARQLERGNTIVPLEPKMYELLEVLIKRRPVVVTNNQLDELLWPNVYVARTSLTRLVSELRAGSVIRRATRALSEPSTRPDMRSAPT
jgi:DNA-binding winged helix-turn-helix (wHTH) protein